MSEDSVKVGLEENHGALETHNIGHDEEDLLDCSAKIAQDDDAEDYYDGRYPLERTFR